MAEWICEQCSVGFKRERNGTRAIRFCSQPCYHAWRKENGVTAGQFEKGLVPWNKGVKGLRMSPATEFKKGQRPVGWTKVGTVRIRTEKRRRRRAWIKIAEPNVWQLRAVMVWARAYGSVPKGCVVHHLDRDVLNDSLTNLACISRAAHINEHRMELRR